MDNPPWYVDLLCPPYLADAAPRNWSLTPSTTPTDATFSPSALQTPRSSTHFQDAFSPYGHHRNVSGDGLTSMEQFNDNMYDQATMTFAHNQSPNQFLQSPKHTGAASFQPVLQNIPIQTPPSARPQSEKRRLVRPHSIMFGAPTSMDHVLHSQNQYMVDHSHMGMVPQSAPHPSMHINYQRHQTSMGPPPNQPYWNVSQAMAMQAQQQQQQQQQHNNNLDDPFFYQPQPHETLRSNDSPHFVTTTPQLFTPARPAHLQQAPIVPSNAQKPLPPPPSEEAPNMMRGPGGVDPTLLYSSPNRMAPPAAPQPMVPSSRHSDSMSPEKPPTEVAYGTPVGKSAVDHLSPLADHDSQRPGSSGGLRGGLRRNPNENRRPHSMYGSIELGRTLSAAGIQRKSSPLKRNNRNSTTSLASILESSTPKASSPALTRARTSIVLTVDSKGRARAETRTFDPSPSKAMQSRYPSLWSESDSESDSDVTTISSQQPSLGSTSDERRRAKLESTLDSLEGLHLPRSNSSASIRNTPVKTQMSAAAQLRRQSSVKKSYAHSRRNTLSSIGGVSDRDAMSTSSDDDKANGDAGAALRKAIERRGQHREQAAARLQARTSQQNQARRPPMPGRSSSLMDLSNSFEQPPAMQMARGYHSQSASPIKQQQELHHVPHGYNDHQMSSVTRCICNMPIPDGQMIQCGSCQSWLHAACLGIPPDRLPHTYFCTFCMAAPPQQQRMGWETAAAF